MPSERLTLSFFEVVLHRKPKGTPLSLELKACFEYFDEHSPSKHAFPLERIGLIHSNDLTLRRVSEGKGYSIEIGGKVRVLGVNPIPGEEQREIIKKIRNVTIPYAEHVAKKKHS